jgi:protein gp37
MNKSKIEWCDRTWNPITGCLHGCQYCYAERIAKRFCTNEHGKEGLLSPCSGDCKDCSEMDGLEFVDAKNRVSHGNGIFPFGFFPTLHLKRMSRPAGIKKPQNVFVCSMADLFGEWVPDEYIKMVFEATNKAPWHNYFYLTKNPNRYYQLGDGDDLIIPEGGIQGYFGASACTEKQAQEAWENLNCSWMSLEPLHGEFGEEFFTHDNRYTNEVEPRWLWIVIGAETGNRKGRVIPKREWVEAIVNECRKNNIPVFLKNNLAPVWGDSLIQEYPWEKG